MERFTGPGSNDALLALEDGRVFSGRSIGRRGEAFGELVFNTAMTGYQEVLTDPSYRGQIVVMCYPEIGIYGITPEDAESGQIQVSGFVVHRAVQEPSNARSRSSLPDYLDQEGVVAIEGVDTRALVRHIRTHGAMRGGLSCLERSAGQLITRVRQSPQMTGLGLASQIIPQVPASSSIRADSRFHVVVVDTGRKENILRALARRGARISMVPSGASLETVLSLQPDGVLVSNGPGDPDPLRETIALMRGLLEHRVPLAGICLGHQLLGLALGGSRYKMCFGHRGTNHPVKDLNTGQVLITTQNHGFAVDPTSLGVAWQPLDAGFVPVNPDMLEGDRLTAEVGVTMAALLPTGPLVGQSPLGFGAVKVTHFSLNDGTLEGLELLEYPALSVQYHPEAAPGPHDAASFFDQFLALVEMHSA